MPAPVPVLTVLSRQWCHLCHELVDQLEPLADAYGFAIDVIDVDAHPELEHEWGEWVPVVFGGGTRLCHYHLDEPAVRAYCQQFQIKSRS